MGEMDIEYEREIMKDANNVLPNKKFNFFRRIEINAGLFIIIAEAFLPLAI